MVHVVLNSPTMLDADDTADLACEAFQLHLVDDDCRRCQTAADVAGMCGRGRRLLDRWTGAELAVRELALVEVQ